MIANPGTGEILSGLARDIGLFDRDKVKEFHFPSSLQFSHAEK
jgi:hypothetical protein